jgi:hypothetical protein
MASSAGPISTVRPWARSSAIGSRGVDREVMSICDRRGSRKDSSATASRHSGLPSASIWSRTTETGAVSVPTQFVNRGRAVAMTETPGVARAANTAGSTGSIR